MPGEQPIAVSQSAAHIHELRSEALCNHEFGIGGHEHVHLHGEKVVIGRLLVVFAANDFVVTELAISEEAGRLNISELLVGVQSDLALRYIVTGTSTEVFFVRTGHQLDGRDYRLVAA